MLILDGKRVRSPDGLVHLMASPDGTTRCGLRPTGAGTTRAESGVRLAGPVCWTCLSADD